jgi:hypothetical protein
MRQKGENSVNRAGKAAVPPDEKMISSVGSKVNPSHLAGFAALRDCPRKGEAAPVARFKAGIASRNSVKVSTFDQFSPWLQPIISDKQPVLPATEEVMQDLAELMQRLFEIQSGGRKRSPELIAEDERLMNGLQTKLSQDGSEQTRFKV